MENTNWCEYLLHDIQYNIDEARKCSGFDSGELSDGHHTFNELYDFRLMYNAVL